MSGFQFNAQGPFIVSAVNDNRDYSIDWTNLLNSGETIATVTWVVPTGVAAGSSSVTGNVSTQFLITPTVGSYYITAEMTTSAGRVFNRSFKLIVAKDI